MAQEDGLYLIVFKKFLKSVGGRMVLFYRRKGRCVSGKTERGQSPRVATDVPQRRRGSRLHLLGDAACTLGVGCAQVWPVEAETLGSALPESCRALLRAPSHHIGSLKKFSPLDPFLILHHLRSEHLL